MSEDKRLGKVKSAYVEIEDHGVLTLWVHLDFGGSCQGFGGHSLDGPAGPDLIRRVFGVFDVTRFDSMIGRTVYATRNAPGGIIVGLETPPFDKGEPLRISEWREEWFPEEEA